MLRRGGDIHISSSPREATLRHGIFRGQKKNLDLNSPFGKPFSISGQSHYTLLPGTKFKIFLQVIVTGKRALMERFIVFEF